MTEENTTNTTEERPQERCHMERSQTRRPSSQTQAHVALEISLRTGAPKYPGPSLSTGLPLRGILGTWASDYKSSDTWWRGVRVLIRLVAC